MAKENNKDRILKLLKDNMTRQTAEEIATQLDIQRNTASGILNDLVREGIVQKEKTRPVMFSYIEPEEELPDDPFTTFIGACRFYYLDQVELERVFWLNIFTNMPNSLEPFRKMHHLLF